MFTRKNISLGLVFGTTLLGLFSCSLGKRTDRARDLEASIARGKYLTIIGGCNDCHTAGFAQSGGKIPESEWLKGDPLGWQGPWGTTYAMNLRLYANGFTEDQWVTVLRASNARPPMPAYALHTMSEDDLRAVYQFLRSLGSAGEVMPDYVPPNKEPETPYILLEPVMPKKVRKK